MAEDQQSVERSRCKAWIFFSAEAAAGETRASLRRDIPLWKKIGKQRYVSAYGLARDYALLGEKEQAIEWLERAYEARDMQLLCVRAKKDMWFSSVKNEPGFQAVLKKIGYPH